MAYEIISRPLACAVFALAMIALFASLTMLALGGPLPRPEGIALAVGSVWMIWTPLTDTVKQARVQARSWRVGDVVTAHSSGDAYVIRTPAGQWRYEWNRVAAVRQLFGFVIVEVDGNSYFHIAIPRALWIDRG